MFTDPLTDPTAGQRAELMRQHPEMPQPISDPTAGQSAQLKRLAPELPQPILDPTDPRVGTEVTPTRRV